MTLFDHSILIGSGVMLGGIVGYAFWLRARVVILKTDIIFLYADFKDKCRAIESPHDDLAYKSACGAFDAFLVLADTVSFPLFAYIIGSKRKTESHGFETANEALAKIIDEALSALAQKVAYHITHRTISGGILWLLLRFVPKAIAKRETRDAVRRSIEPLQGVFQHTFVSHCH